MILEKESNGQYQNNIFSENLYQPPQGYDRNEQNLGREFEIINNKYDGQNVYDPVNVFGGKNYQQTPSYNPNVAYNIADQNFSPYNFEEQGKNKTFSNDERYNMGKNPPSQGSAISYGKADELSTPSKYDLKNYKVRTPWATHNIEVI
jgi:hypothetical protein